MQMEDVIRDAAAALFTPYEVKRLKVRNRIAMAPMTRSAAPGGIVGPANADYYVRRARGGAGLIITEGTWIPHAAAGNRTDVPQVGTEASTAAWKPVVQAVHAAGAAVMMQLWHVGLVRKPGEAPNPDVPAFGPASADGEVEAVIAAFGEAAVHAREAGFDGVEIHGAHGYLVDQFFWNGTNQRTGRWGGDYIGRTRFAADIAREIRRRTAEDFPIGIRLSQWKQQDYTATLVSSPQELERFLAPLADAGIDIFHMSTRRFWDAAFAGSDLSMAGWARKLTGRTAITVGSVGLDSAFNPLAGGAAAPAETARPSNVEELARRLERGDFDLVAVGRAMLANADFAEHVRTQAWERMVPYDPEVRKVLY